MAAIEDNNFQSLSSVAVVKSKQKKCIHRSDNFIHSFYLLYSYKSMHKLVDKASAAAAMPHGAGTVCTLITYGSGALRVFTSSTFAAAALDQVAGQERKKKNHMQFKWTVAVARGAKWTTNYDEAACHKDYATHMAERRWGRGKKHVEASRRRLLSALDLIRGRGWCACPTSIPKSTSIFT